MPPKITRRTLLSGLAIGVAGGLTKLLPEIAGVSSAHAGSINPRPQSLGLIAQKAGLLFGASASKEIFDNPAYASLYRSHARLLTTDVALKFDYLRPSQEQWDFAEADQLLAFTQKNNMALRGHTLIWNENAPAWLRQKSGREITYIMDQHIDKVAGRYAGKLHSWDVVNEPFWPGHGKAGGYRTGPWLEALGPSYVKRAFIRAAQADPTTRLVLNEAHCERNDEVGQKIRAGLLRLVDELLDAGVPLHAVGLQGHLQPGKAFNDEVFTDFLWKLHKRGLNIYISEFDINDETFPSAQRARDRQVAQRTHQFLTQVLKVPSVKALICWQLSDRYSWYTNLAHQQNQRPPRPLPFDQRLRPKASYIAMLRAFKERQV
ncbi:MAG: endo-1,4-beta-xylanase [Hyphomicrobiaceae bacterium]|nr:endo-1,4-beta-xylanase [Hyphomicrobiaceae bacterium]